MKFPVAALGLLCLVGDAAAFAPQSRFVMPAQVSRSTFEASPLMAVPNYEEEGQLPSVAKMTNQAASVFAATVIATSTLGLAVTPPPPAFAAPAAKVETVAKKVAAEVAAVDTGKGQLAAATQSLNAAQNRVPAARTADQAAAKELAIAEKNLENAKRSDAAAKERLKSLSSNTKAFDKRTIAAAEAKVGTSCDVFWFIACVCVSLLTRPPFLTKTFHSWSRLFAIFA